MRHIFLSVLLLPHIKGVAYPLDLSIHLMDDYEKIKNYVAIGQEVRMAWHW
jgi:hypothetical protein